MTSTHRRNFLKKSMATIGTLGLSSFTFSSAVSKKAAANKITRKTINLWADDSPNNHVHKKFGRPRLELYVPESKTDQPRAAVLVCPGGGYFHLADHEGQPVAEFLAQYGIIGAVLTYHVHPHHHPLPYADATRAMRLLRQQADTIGIDPDKIAIMGFSAGGHLAATVATQPELYKDPQDDLANEFDARPNRVILGYPVVSFQENYGHMGSAQGLLGAKPDTEMLNQLSNELQVTAENPPAFIFHTADDPVVSLENSLRFATAYHKHQLPIALHVYPHGSHGVGLASDNQALKSWPNLLIGWLRDWTA